MFKGMLSEGSQISAMRVMALISLLFGGIIALYGMYKGSSLTELSLLSGTFVGAAFGGKVMQKIQEVKKDTPISENEIK